MSAIEQETPAELEAAQRLSRALPSVADAIENALRTISKLDAVSFVLLIAPSREVQYVANVKREDGVGMIKRLLERWEHPEGKVDLSLHQKDELVLQLLTQCKRYHDALDIAFTLLVGANKDFTPSKSPMWDTVLEGNKIIEATGRAIALSDALAKEGVISPPPAGERH